MKLETYLNAYGFARYLAGYYKAEWAVSSRTIELYNRLGNKFLRQAEKFRDRLLAKIRTIDDLDELDKAGDEIGLDECDGLHYCAIHHCPLQIVRPGSYQCLECERQEELEKTKVVTVGSTSRIDSNGHFQYGCVIEKENKEMYIKDDDDEVRRIKKPGKFETLCKMAEIFDYSITANVDVNARIRKPFQKDQRDIAIPCEDDVQDFSVAMCKVYKWLVKQACELDRSFNIWYNGGWQE